MSQRLNTNVDQVLIQRRNDFILSASLVHGNKYSYDNVEYFNANTKVRITCGLHGNFLQTPNSHLSGANCPTCTGHFVDTDLFVKKAIAIHGKKYDYSKSEYMSARTKLQIMCPKHGMFDQTPHRHLAKTRPRGCPSCGFDNLRSNVVDFIATSNTVHDGKYDYSHVVYVNAHTKILITCPYHGEFCQSPNSHIRGNGCPTCGAYERGLTTSNEHSPAMLYVIKLEGLDEELIKVGVTRAQSVQERYKSDSVLRAAYIMTPIVEVPSTLRAAYDLEARIKNVFKRDKAFPLCEFGGYTECFHEGALDRILRFVTS